MRARTVLRWTLSSLTLATAALFVVSLWGSVWYLSPRAWGFSVGRGVIAAWTGSDVAGQPALSWQTTINTRPSVFAWWTHTTWTSTTHLILLPL